MLASEQALCTALNPVPKVEHETEKKRDLQRIPASTIRSHLIKQVLESTPTEELCVRF